MADGGSKPAQDAEGLADGEAPTGRKGIVAGMSQRDLDLLREWEQELVGSSAASVPVAPSSTGASLQRVSSPKSVYLPTLAFGLGLTAAGCYVVMERVTLFSGGYYWARMGLGQNGFGLSLLPLLVGIGMLVYGKATLGWALTGLGSLIILLGIPANLSMTFRPASLFEVVLMFGMIAVRLGVTVRALTSAE